MTKLLKVLLWVGIPVVGLGALLIGVFSYASNLKTMGVRQEQQMSATYEDNQNYLSTFVSTFYETTSLANLKSEKMDSILVHAVRGRYGEEGFKANGQFFSAITESYPTIDLSIYDKIVTQVQAGREAFRGRQSILLDVVRSYDSWRLEGLVRPMIISFLGFPSENLKARVGGQTVATGVLALEKFHDIVVTESTAQAFSTGRMGPLTPPRN